MSIKILSWNILQGGGKRAMDIAEQIEKLAPDIVTLQEFRNGKSAPVILDALNKLGLEHQHIVDSKASANTVMMAANLPFSTRGWASDLDKGLCVHATLDIGQASLPALDIFAGHLPQKKAQVPYLDTLDKLNASDFDAAIIIGDLNCGIPFEDSESKSFVNTHIFQSILRKGWTDAWRERNPGKREYSWISSRGNAYRYDHCLVNEPANKRISSIEYIQSVREERLSDHAAILLELNPH